MSTPNGGPAFPQQDNTLLEKKGMTLRDYFAAKAMQGLITVYADDEYITPQYAEKAYKIADAMLKVRAK